MRVLVVDYESEDAPRRLAESLRKTGFAVIVNHPIRAEDLAAVYAEWEEFFLSEAKWKYPFDKESTDGYYSHAVSERAKGFEQKDLKEYFHIFPWGRYPTEVSNAARRHYDAAGAIAAKLLGWIEQETPEDVAARFSMPLSRMIEDSPRTLLRVLRYPEMRGDEPAGAQRAAAHEDINLLTVLPAANEPGLEVRDREGRWHAVPCDPGTLVINAGDMLQEASGGYYPSTTHRVVNPEGDEATRARISMPLFLHPRDEVVLSERYTSRSYLDERLRELGIRE